MVQAFLRAGSLQHVWSLISRNKGVAFGVEGLGGGRIYGLSEKD